MNRALDRLLRGYRRLRHPSTFNHLAPHRNELVWNALWGDLATYNAEVSHGVQHRRAWTELMRRKQELFDELNDASYREAGYVPVHDRNGEVIGWSGEGDVRTLHWDEARIRELYPEAAHDVFDYLYDHRDDVIWHVDRSELVTAGL